MSDNVIDVTGIAMYPRLFETNRDMGSRAGENGAKYSYDEATTISVILDQEELAKVTQLVPDIKPSVTEDGLMVKFRRKWVNKTNPAWGGPPVVKDAEGEPWSDSLAIGNGSKVRVAAEVYKHNFGTSMRLMGVQVLEHVEADLPDGPELPF